MFIPTFQASASPEHTPPEPTPTSQKEFLDEYIRIVIVEHPDATRYRIGKKMIDELKAYELDPPFKIDTVYTLSSPEETEEAVGAELSEDALIALLCGDGSARGAIRASRRFRNPIIALPAGYSANTAMSAFSFWDRYNIKSILEDGEIVDGLAMSYSVTEPTDESDEETRPPRIDAHDALDNIILGNFALAMAALEHPKHRAVKETLTRVEQFNLDKRVAVRAMKKHGSYKAELNGLPASFDQLAFFKGPRWAVFARAPIELTDSHFCVVETLASTSLGKKINDLRIYGGVPPRRATTYHKTYTVRALEDIPLQYSGEKDTLHENELLTVEMVEEPIRIVTTRRHLLPKHY